MGFMDSVSVFTKGVSAKAKGNYDVVAMNAQISALKREINDLYLKIGETYYKEFQAAPADPVAELINEVTAKFASIDELNKQIETTKAEAAAVQLTVAKEPAEAPKPVNTPAAQQAPANEENVQAAESGATKKFCSSCGTELASDAMFCPKCGTKAE